MRAPHALIAAVAAERGHGRVALPPDRLAMPAPHALAPRTSPLRMPNGDSATPSQDAGVAPTTNRSDGADP